MLNWFRKNTPEPEKEGIPLRDGEYAVVGAFVRDGWIFMRLAPKQDIDGMPRGTELVVEIYPGIVRHGLSAGSSTAMACFETPS